MRSVCCNLCTVQRDDKARANRISASIQASRKGSERKAQIPASPTGRANKSTPVHDETTVPLMPWQQMSLQSMCGWLVSVRNIGTFSFELITGSDTEVSGKTGEASAPKLQTCAVYFRCLQCFGSLSHAHHDRGRWRTRRAITAARTQCRSSRFA